MRRRLIEHLLGIVAVGAAFLVILSLAGPPPDPAREARERRIAPYLAIEGLDFGDPLHRAMFRETVASVSSRSTADSLLAAIDEHRSEAFSTPSLKTGAREQGVTPARLARLAPMYLQFLLVYVVVLLCTTYGAKTLGVYRFTRMKRGASAGVTGLRPLLLLALGPRGLLKVAAYAVMFSPAYVIAYALRTTVDTGSLVFMVVLGVVSNGLLVTYANKFYTFLVHESRRGYVETAMVKNLTSSYDRRESGISLRAVLRPVKHFPAHVFQHIYMNARYQYIPTVKEQASFVVTGLVIIEMALNIQGLLCYELLQNVLFRDYEVVAVIVGAIFVAVKCTDIVVDAWYERETRRFENRPA